MVRCRTRASSARPRLGAAALSLAALLSLAPVPTLAAAFSSAFVIADLPVDATGKNGVAARDAARAAAEKQALQLVLRRLTAPQDWSRLPQLDGDDVTDLVLDFEVESEHVSASHYLGRYTFRFDPKGIRQLLQGANIPFTELVSKRVVAIPLFQDATGTRLWDDPNPWRDAWNAAHGPAGLVPWIVPVGDLGDVQSLDVPDAQHPTPDKLVAMSQRYGGGDIVIASAVEQDTAPAQTPPAPDAGSVPAPPPAPAVTLQITVTRYSATGTDSESTSVSGPKADAGLFLSGVIASEQMLEDLWKKVSLAPSPPVTPASTAASATGVLTPPTSQQVEVDVPIASAVDWVKMRDRIAQVSGVLGTRLEAMTKDQVLLQLSLSGEPQSLALAFAQQDLTLAAGTNGGPLVLRPRTPGDTGLLAPSAGTTASAPTQLAPAAAQTELAPLPAQTLGTVPVPPATAKPENATPAPAPLDDSPAVGQ